MDFLEKLKELLGGKATETEFERFAKQLRIVRGVIAASPIAGMVVPPLHFLWPPLSSLTNFAGVFASVLVSIVGLVPSQIRSKQSAKKWMIAAIVIAVLALVAYGFFFEFHVYCTEWGDSHCFTIGSCSDPANCPRSGEDYEARFQKAGHTSTDSFEGCFTSLSVHIARLELFLTCFLVLVSINFAVGCLARVTVPNVRSDGRGGSRGPRARAPTSGGDKAES